MPLKQERRTLRLESSWSSKLDRQWNSQDQRHALERLATLALSFQAKWKLVTGRLVGTLNSKSRSETISTELVKTYLVACVTCLDIRILLNEKLVFKKITQLGENLCELLVV